MTLKRLLGDMCECAFTKTRSITCVVPLREGERKGLCTFAILATESHLHRLDHLCRLLERTLCCKMLSLANTAFDISLGKGSLFDGVEIRLWLQFTNSMR